MKNTKEKVKEALKWINSIILAFIIAIIIRSFIFEPVYVDGESMENTLFAGQRLLVYKLGYFFSTPQRGDIVVLRVQDGNSGNLGLLKSIPILRYAVPDFDEIDYIKRVIAVSGDTIYTSDGSVYVNGIKLYESYIQQPTLPGIETPVTVPQGQVFVMGDNRQNSRDSREIGCISIDRIKGKAVIRIWPFDVLGSL